MSVASSGLAETLAVAARNRPSFATPSREGQAVGRPGGLEEGGELRCGGNGVPNGGGVVTRGKQQEVFVAS